MDQQAIAEGLEFLLHAQQRFGGRALEKRAGFKPGLPAKKLPGDGDFDQAVEGA
jgi:hypothetical protein